MPDLNDYQDWENKRQEMESARITLENATAAFEAINEKLAKSMAPGKQYFVAPDQLPLLTVIDGRVQRVHAPFLGDPDPDVPSIA